MDYSECIIESPYELGKLNRFFRGIRAEKMLSGSEVSVKSGLHHNTLYDIENKKENRSIKLWTLTQLASFYGLEVVVRKKRKGHER